MSPTTVNKCKSNIAEATGMMGAGACATSVIRWAFRKGQYTNASADPRVCIPYDHIKAWIAMYNRMSNHDKIKVTRNWRTKYARMKNAKSKWQCVRGPMDATIATLMEARWKPESPTRWVTPDGDETNFIYEQGISHHRVLHELRAGLEADLWKHAADADRGSGLEDGTPHFGPASSIYDAFVKKGKHAMARALELIITNRSWCGARLLQENIITEEEAKCKRCSMGILETPYHRYYQCPANDIIDEEEVTNSQYLHTHVKRNTKHECMWFRGILPGRKIAEPVGWVDEAECEATVLGKFSETLHKTGKVGTDGGGDQEKDPRNRRVSAGAAVFDPDTNEVAMLFAKVPGNQTVPRAELYALLQTIVRMRDDIEYTVYVDASYVLNGLASRTHHYSQGTNGDLWTRLYEASKTKQVIYRKVKSHVTNMDQWVTYNMTEEALIYNEMADKVCTLASAVNERSFAARVDDGRQHRLASKAAARIAAIEAEIWKDTPERIYHEGTDFTKLLELRKKAVKRKTDDSIANTSGGQGHDTITRNGWTLCLNCPNKAHEKNISYWNSRPCLRMQKRAKPTATDRHQRDYEAYKLKHPNDTDEEEDVTWVHQAAPDIGLTIHPDLECQECLRASDYVVIKGCTSCERMLCVECTTDHDCRRDIGTAGTDVTTMPPCTVSQPTSTAPHEDHDDGDDGLDEEIHQALSDEIDNLIAAGSTDNHTTATTNTKEGDSSDALQTLLRMFPEAPTKAKWLKVSHGKWCPADTHGKTSLTKEQAERIESSKAEAIAKKKAKAKVSEAAATSGPSKTATPDRAEQIASVSGSQCEKNDIEGQIIAAAFEASKQATATRSGHAKEKARSSNDDEKGESKEEKAIGGPDNHSDQENAMIVAACELSNREAIRAVFGSSREVKESVPHAGEERRRSPDLHVKEKKKEKEEADEQGDKDGDKVPLTTDQTLRIESNKAAAAAKSKAKAITKMIAANKKAAIERKKTKETADALKAYAAQKEAERLKSRSSFDDPEAEVDPDLHYDPRQDKPEGKRRKKDNDEDKEEHKEEGTEKKKRKHVAAIRDDINEKVKAAKTEATGRWKGHLAAKSSKPPVKADIETVDDGEEAREGAGYDKIHSSHKRFTAGCEIIFCWHCGYWMKTKPQKLQDECDISNLSSFQKSMRSKLRKGLYPQKVGGLVKTWKDGTSTENAVTVEPLDPA